MTPSSTSLDLQDRTDITYKWSENTKEAVQGRQQYTCHITYVRANYGIIRVMQSCFLSSFKMSATADVAGGTRRVASRHSSIGGSKGLGEMEVTQMIASGLSHTLCELSDRSDVHIVEVCTRCKRLVGLCKLKITDM